MAENILYAGIDELTELRNRVEVQEIAKNRIVELEAEQQNLAKIIDSAKKAMNDEIDSTIKSRRAELEATYKKEISGLSKDVKKLQSAKTKEKQEKVAAKVVTETEVYHEKIKSLKQDIKNYVRENKLPHMVRRNWFYALFMPRTFLQGLCAVLVFILLFLCLPFGVCKLLNGCILDSYEYTAAVVYLVDVALFGGLYVFINNSVKEKNREKILDIIDLRAEIRENKRRIKRVSRGIQRDKDESQYGLQDFDNELSEMDDKLKILNEDQQKALDEFVKVTKPQLIEEITTRHEIDINRFQADKDESAAELKRLTEQVRNEALEFSKTFESGLGKANMNLPTIDRLIAIISEGKAKNVSEALVIYKAEQSANNK